VVCVPLLMSTMKVPFPKAVMFICGNELSPMADGSGAATSVASGPSEVGEGREVGLGESEASVQSSRPFQFLCGAALASARRL
jgi:hypothetical protein